MTTSTSKPIAELLGTTGYQIGKVKFKIDPDLGIIIAHAPFPCSPEENIYAQCLCFATRNAIALPLVKNLGRAGVILPQSVSQSRKLLESYFYAEKDIDIEDKSETHIGLTHVGICTLENNVNYTKPELEAKDPIAAAWRLSRCFNKHVFLKRYGIILPINPDQAIARARRHQELLEEYLTENPAAGFRKIDPNNVRSID